MNPSRPEPDVARCPHPLEKRYAIYRRRSRAEGRGFVTDGSRCGACGKAFDDVLGGVRGPAHED